LIYLVPNGLLLLLSTYPGLTHVYL